MKTAALFLFTILQGHLAHANNKGSMVGGEPAKLRPAITCGAQGVSPTEGFQTGTVEVAYEYNAGSTGGGIVDGVADQPLKVVVRDSSSKALHYYQTNQRRIPSMPFRMSLRDATGQIIGTLEVDPSAGRYGSTLTADEELVLSDCESLVD